MIKKKIQTVPKPYLCLCLHHVPRLHLLFLKNPNFPEHTRFNIYFFHFQKTKTKVIGFSSLFFSSLLFSRVFGSNKSVYSNSISKLVELSFSIHLSRTSFIGITLSKFLYLFIRFSFSH